MSLSKAAMVVTSNLRPDGSSPEIPDTARGCVVGGFPPHSDDIQLSRSFLDQGGNPCGLGLGVWTSQRRFFSLVAPWLEIATSVLIFHYASNTSVPEVDKCIPSGRMIPDSNKLESVYRHAKNVAAW